MEEKVCLIPLDGTAVSESAIPIAIAMSRILGLRPALVEVVQDVSGDINDRNVQELRPVQHYLRGVAADQRVADLHLETHAVPSEGNVADGIISASERLHASLIVMATSGATGLKRLFSGSVVDDVVKRSSVPVLATRGDADLPREAWTLRRLLVPLDSSPVAETALEPAVELALAANAELVLSQVVNLAMVYAPAGDPTGQQYVMMQDDLVHAGEEYLGGIKERLEAAHPGQLSITTYVLQGAPAPTLIDHADAVEADLVVMTTHARRGLARVALGSVADRLLRAGNTPLLLLPVRHE